MTGAAEVTGAAHWAMLEVRFLKQYCTPFSLIKITFVVVPFVKILLKKMENKTKQALFLTGHQTL